jgi:threonine/homoserine/homoserine lactone efflux protein
MDAIGNLYLFLASVVLISMSGVLMPGPLFAITIDKASKRRSAGVFIALGHGVVEFPLMVLIYFGLTQFGLPEFVQIAIGLLGGLLMILMGIRMFRKRGESSQKTQSTKQDSFVAGIWTTAANAGFILWWTTVGTTLLINAQVFGLIGFSAFAVAHWFCDFLWYSVVALLIFKSHRFWTRRVHQAIFLFCFLVLVGYGSWFFGSALYSALIKIL